jgi:hypothetical protein
MPERGGIPPRLQSAGPEDRQQPEPCVRREPPKEPFSSPLRSPLPSARENAGVSIGARAATVVSSPICPMEEYPSILRTETCFIASSWEKANVIPPLPA